MSLNYIKRKYLSSLANWIYDKNNAFSRIYYENYVATELSTRGLGLFY